MANPSEDANDPLAGRIHFNWYAAQTSAVLNGPAKPTERDRTYVITGNGRGGTSMVAGVAYLLGLELGSGLGGEDLAFTRVGQGYKPQIAVEPLDPNSPGKIELLRNTVEHRNSHHSVWGWKDPSVELYLPEISDLLRNPHLIVVWRDPAAIATALMAINGLSAADAFALAFENSQRFWSLVQSLHWPTLMVSYERGRLKPLELAKEMAVFLGLRLTDQIRDNIVRYCSPSGGYYGTPDLAVPPTLESQQQLRERLTISSIESEIRNGCVKIVGTAKTGETLKAAKSDFDPNPGAYDHQWLRNGQPIPGETDWEYVVVPGDCGAELAVQVTATRDGFIPQTVESLPLTVTES